MTNTDTNTIQEGHLADIDEAIDALCDEANLSLADYLDTLEQVNSRITGLIVAARTDIAMGRG